MKKSLLLLSVITSATLIAGDTHALEGQKYTKDGKAISPVSASHTNEFGDAFTKGKFSLDARLFYMKRTFDTPIIPDAEALTFGAIMKYESAAYKDFKVGLAYYGNERVSGAFTRKEGVGTSNLQPFNPYAAGDAGDDINFLGEAYLEYNVGNTMVKVGRQRLSTPLANDHDLRALPSVYEAAIVRNTDIPDTMVELGYIQAYTGFVSRNSQFNDFNRRWGDKGLAYLSLSNKSVKNLVVKAQYAKAISNEDKNGADITIEDYKYLDLKYDIPFGDKTYIKAQYGGNAFQAQDDSTMYGTKVGTSVSIVDLALVFDKITDNRFKAIEAGPMYTDWQQGYGFYEPSTAYGAQVVVKPMDDLSLKVGYVDVTADEGNLRDDFAEFNFDGKYALNSWSKLRIRYSIKNQTSRSEAAISLNPNGSTGRKDRTDFRITYYVSF